MARGFLFDYGGTLDGEGWHWFDRTLELYRRAGCTVAGGEIKRAFYTAEDAIGEEAMRGRYRLRPLVERHVELQLAVLGDAARRFARTVVDGFCEITIDGWGRSRALFERLEGRFRIGVVSNFYGNLDVLLAEAGLARFIDAVVESAHVAVAKPDPTIYRLAVKRTALRAADLVMVGDNLERDCRVAKSLGMGAIWIRRGDGEPPAKDVADRVIRRLDEIEPATPAPS